MSSNQLTLKGFRDFFPEDMAIRREVERRLVTVFKKYGFSELTTPALERAEVLLGKYGPEAEKLMYLFTDHGDRKVGLKYDLTVPLARAVASNPDITLPFKRYQIQPVWRAENTQKGRYREFYQCDFDIIGSSSPMSDAEILAVISDSLTVLEFMSFTIKVNSRTVLFSVMESASIDKSAWLSTIQSIDKLDKKSEDEVKQELSEKGLSGDQISTLFNELKNAQPDAYLAETLSYAKKFGAVNIVFDPTISRGLDYYTGPIFETVVSEPKIGSLTGGGRYDNLLKTIGGPDLPAVGSTIGMERIIDVITELGLWKEKIQPGADVLVTLFNEELSEESVRVATILRKNNINTELWSERNVKLDKQLKYADKKAIPFVVIIGPEEMENNNVVLKNLSDQTQQKVSVEELASFLKNK